MFNNRRIPKKWTNKYSMNENQLFAQFISSNTIKKNERWVLKWKWRRWRRDSEVWAGSQNQITENTTHKKREIIKKVICSQFILWLIRSFSFLELILHLHLHLIIFLNRYFFEFNRIQIKRRYLCFNIDFPGTFLKELLYLLSACRYISAPIFHQWTRLINCRNFRYF